MAYVLSPGPPGAREPSSPRALRCTGNVHGPGNISGNSLSGESRLRTSGLFIGPEVGAYCIYLIAKSNPQRAILEAGG